MKEATLPPNPGEHDRPTKKPMDLDGLKELMRGAAPRPWYSIRLIGLTAVCVSPKFTLTDTLFYTSKEDADLIVEAINKLPELMVELEAARQTLAKKDAALQEILKISEESGYKCEELRAENAALQAAVSHVLHDHIENMNIVPDLKGHICRELAEAAKNREAQPWRAIL